MTKERKLFPELTKQEFKECVKDGMHEAFLDIFEAAGIIHVKDFTDAICEGTKDAMVEYMSNEPMKRM